MDNFSGWYWFIAFVIMTIVAIFASSMVENNQDAKDLGNAICDQEYKMDFDSYDDKELKCKPKEIKAEKQYDGITVQIR